MRRRAPDRCFTSHGLRFSRPEASLCVFRKSRTGIPLSRGQCFTKSRTVWRWWSSGAWLSSWVIDFAVFGAGQEGRRLLLSHAVAQEHDAVGVMNNPVENGVGDCTLRCVPGSTTISASPSTSPPRLAPGSTLSRASSPSCRSDASSEASFILSSTCRRPSTASSQSTIDNANPSPGPPTPTKSSPPSNVGTKC